VLDNVSTSSRSIPGRKLFLNFEKNGGRRVELKNKHNAINYQLHTIISIDSFGE
jgi:hypothetical protein